MQSLISTNQDDILRVRVCFFFSFHLWISVMLSVPVGIAEGFSLLCLLFA